MSADTLLADMRRKYLHARERMQDRNWLRSEPITVQILERWIPEVEAMQSYIAALQSNLADANGRYFDLVRRWEALTIARPSGQINE